MKFKDGESLQYRELKNDELVISKNTTGEPKKARLFMQSHDRRGYWEISVVYFRVGYDPAHYQPDTEG